MQGDAPVEAGHVNLSTESKHLLAHWAIGEDPDSAVVHSHGGARLDDLQTGGIVDAYRMARQVPVA